jgi:hypothetical protein
MAPFDILSEARTAQTCFSGLRFFQTEIPQT